MSYDFDLFTIGAGSGGVRATRMAAMAGARTAIAEEFRVGGTCVIRGCVPKKLFVHAADFAQTFRQAAHFGWRLDTPRFDWTTLRDNVAREVDRLSGIYSRNLMNSGVEVLHERAEIVDAHTVRLARTGRAVTAERILVATGGRPYRPADLPGQDLAITSDDAFHLDHLPKRVAVIGGGYIAVEFATIFHGLGVETTLIYRGDTVLRGFDEDVRTHIHAELIRQGVRVVTGAGLASIEKRGEALVTKLASGEEFESDKVMLAVGREPYTQGLGLEQAGVALNARGAVVVDAYSRTNVASIYAVGDVTDRLNLTPVAIREGQAFAETIYYNRPTAFDHADVPTAVFSRPPVGAVGLSEREARMRFGAVDIYTTTFRPMRNVIAHDDERTLMKLVVRPSDNVVLGVHIAGQDGPEMIQLAAIAVKAGLTKAQWDATCALHPTAAEELVTLREKARPITHAGEA